MLPRMLTSLNYGGDGDEVAAVARVEREFGVTFLQEDADTWVTVGDIFGSLLNKLDLTKDEGKLLWPRFADAIAWENGFPGSEVSPETLFLAPPIFEGAFFRWAWKVLRGETP